MSSPSFTAKRLNIQDLLIGTAIALVMAAVFTMLSHGRSLLVTFLPGLAFSWGVFVWIYQRKAELPRAEAFLPLFFVTLAVQFLHFSEEFVTGFRTLFATFYGGAPYEANLFVVFNMASYAIFTVSALLVFYRGVGFLLMPVLFFTVYGALGNAISHTWWVIDTHAYFPGFYTALAYWVLGPWLLTKLLGARWRVAALFICFAVVLVVLLTHFATAF